jgi:POT family proton-dependent oligopeptide transporter
VSQQTAVPAASDLLWGHPKGVYYLAMTEAWERFSFYGMRGLLILYLVQELLLPGHVENVIGMAAFRPFIESIFGPLSTQAFASQLFGLYAGFVYFTPLIGGWLADGWLGARKTVSLGILLMGAGHVLMIWEQTVLFALLLLVLGSGCLKGNIAAQVGHLYPAHDEARRSTGFTIFSTGINIGATIGPVICGLLAQIYGWHVGFGAAGTVMAIAALVYFMGLKHFAPDRRSVDEARPAMTPNDWQLMAMVLLILVILTFWSIAYDQTANVGLLWVADHVALDTAWGNFPVPWFTAEDSLASIIAVPMLLAIFGWQGRRGSAPTDLHKIAVGSAIMAASVGTMALGSVQAGDGGKASLLFPLIAFFLSGLSFMYVWPTALALVSRRAPMAINARMMAGVYLTSFVSGVGSGWLGRYYEPLGPVNFWWLMAAISLSAAILIMLFGRMIERRMDTLDAAGAAMAPKPALAGAN